MSNNRRTVLKKLGGIVGLTAAGSIGAVGSVQARGPLVRGRVQKPDNSPAANEIIGVSGRGIAKTLHTDSGGNFEFDPEGASKVALGFYETEVASFEQTSRKDGSPDLFTFPLQDLTGRRKHLGNFKLPEAHLLQAKVVDGSGDPITDVWVNFEHIIPGGDKGFVINAWPVNQDGEFQHPNAAEPGFELVGDIRARVLDGKRRGDLDVIAEKRFELTSDQTIEFVLDEE